jgi:uncharacterized membrane protein (DUF485 family)
MTTKPASASRTLKFNNLATIVSAVAAAIPTLLSYALALLGDPQIADAVSNLVPLRYRALFVLVVLYIARANVRLRMSTAVPIEGSPGARELEQKAAP